METFGEYIKDLRKSKGLTLTKLAASLDIDQATLSKIENNKKQASKDILPALATIFNLDLESLQDEFYSNKIAYELFEENCSDKVLALAEKKIKYIRSKKIKQGNLRF